MKCFISAVAAMAVLGLSSAVRANPRAQLLQMQIARQQQLLQMQMARQQQLQQIQAARQQQLLHMQMARQRQIQQQQLIVQLMRHPRVPAHVQNLHQQNLTQYLMRHPRVAGRVVPPNRGGRPAAVAGNAAYWAFLENSARNASRVAHNDFMTNIGWVWVPGRGWMPGQ
jgi:hypothetical protein